MADKATVLSVIIRAIDQSTARVQAINASLATLTKPIKDSNKAFGELREHLGLLGLDAVKDGFSGVGRAVGDLLGKAAMVGGVIAGAAVAAAIELKALVDQFATLGHTAQRAGVEVDFLAGIRYAGEKAGLAVEQVDEAMTTLTQNMGQAKAGTGRMLKFLQQVSPVLAQQVVHANNAAEVLGLLADAEAKLPDAARRAALAQKTLGNEALAPVLMHGSKAIQEQMGAYAGLAGSQDGAVKGALSVEEAMVDLKASTDGVKAALVTGLSPAIRGIVDDMTTWLVAHRADVEQWAADIGKKLPGAVDDVVKSIKGAVSWVQGFVDDIGGWKVAAGALAAVIAGPLIASVAALGVALLATPFGQVLLALTPIVAAIASLVSETEAFEDVAKRLGFASKKDTVAAVHQGVPYDASYEADLQAMLQNGRDAAASEARAKAALDDDPVIQKARLLGDQRDALLAIPQSGAPQSGAQEVKIKVDFANAPKGMRAAVAAAGGTYVDMTTGYQMGTP